MNRDDPAAPATEEEESSPVLADEEEEEERYADDDEAESGDGEGEERNAAADDDEAESEYDDEVDVPLKTLTDDSKAFLAGGNMELMTRRCVILNGLKRDLSPRFASAGSTAGVLRVYTEENPVEGEPPQRQIMLLYRFTRFISSGSGDGVAVRGFRSTKLHEMRFAVPDDGDAAASLRRWAGPALGPLIYPASHACPLEELWARLVSDMRVPPRAWRVYLRADVGILRRGDYTTRRMGRVSYYLGGMTEETWPVSMYHVGMELQLPEPVLRRPCEDEAKGKGKGKEEEDECSVCLEELESGLAKWPGCFQPHVFHGECLELCLKESEKCPICRRRLSAPVDG
ncbi:hypothetical protein BRADI_2g20630v3 [Brachypodium distachyon]|uniref:RING-type E3 ubiquitin transferase n=1 Tax=Brachypodium distachyon TaxID=15368 RepID=A0A2K2D9L5_BRADI|nr:hypothetical protein BRADI_2g20630v3 [Brachypodium distachyon]